MKRMTIAIVAGLVFLPLLTLNAGCTDQQMEVFRTGLMPGLSSGVQTILDAVVQGAFAAATPNQSPSTGTH